MTQPSLFNNLPDMRRIGYKCKCCGSFLKQYKRSLNCNMALLLIVLYRSGNKDFVHLEELMRTSGHKRAGDASYLVHWGFLKKCTEEREDGSSRNGKYKITPMGMMFVEQKINAKESILIFNGKFEGFEGEEINIITALGKKFNYTELMSA